MRFPFCVVPIADHTNETEVRTMTASFAPTTHSAAQIRLRSLAESCEVAMKPELGHSRDSRRGWDYGNTFGRWPE
jgi:maleate cis-trans isomerase